MGNIEGSCWWEGGLNFSKLLRHNFVFFPSFKANKLESLLTKIEEDVCTPHDEDYNRWWLLFSYLYANYLFAYRLSLKFRWTAIWLQMVILIIAFIFINIGGVQYYTWKIWKNVIGG